MRTWIFHESRDGRRSCFLRWTSNLDTFYVQSGISFRMLIFDLVPIQYLAYTPDIGIHLDGGRLQLFHSSSAQPTRWLNDGQSSSLNVLVWVLWSDQAWARSKRARVFIFSEAARCSGVLRKPSRFLRIVGMSKMDLMLAERLVQTPHDQSLLFVKFRLLTNLCVMFYTAFFHSVHTCI